MVKRCILPCLLALFILSIAGCGDDPVLSWANPLNDGYTAPGPVPDSYLQGLTIDGVPLYPNFSHNTTNYFGGVAITMTNIRLQATLSDPLASMTLQAPGYAGTALSNSNWSTAITLSPGTNRIEIRVTAADGISTLVYGIDFVRSGVANASSNNYLASLTASPGSLTPAFVSNTNQYELEIPWNQGSVSFTPTTSDPDALLLHKGMPITSGIPLAVSTGYGYSTNVFTVIAPDFSARDYRITVYRPLAAVMYLLITEWYASGTDRHFIELRNFGTNPALIDEDFRLYLGLGAELQLNHWLVGTNWDAKIDVSDGAVPVAPGQIVLIVESDFLYKNSAVNTTHWEYHRGKGMPADTLIFYSDQTTLLGSNKRLHEGPAWMAWDEAVWGYTPPIDLFETEVGTSTVSKLKSSFDISTDSTSDTVHWTNGSSSIASPGIWD